MKKETEISNEVRKKVYERDSHEDAPCCILCGRPYPEIHHYIERSRGGMGIEQNLVCLCAECHQRYHRTEDREIKDGIKEYLQYRYPNWDEDKLIYRRTI